MIRSYSIISQIDPESSIGKNQVRQNCIAAEVECQVDPYTAVERNGVVVNHMIGIKYPDTVVPIGNRFCACYIGPDQVQKRRR